MVGRERELQILREFYDNSDTNVIAVTGRTGIGKTTLIKEFVKDKQCIFFTAYSTTEMHQRALFGKAVGIDDDQSTLDQIYSKVTAMSDEGTAVLVIDHYADFAKTDKKFPESLYKYMTTVWKQGTVKLILCDSSSIQMEKSVYGPRAVWNSLHPVILTVDTLYFDEAVKMLPDTDRLTESEIYGITGGIPVLLEIAAEGLKNNPEDAVWRTIERIFLSKFFDFKGSPENILGRELREKAYYDRLMYSLAHGYLRVNQLSEQLGKPKDVVVPYLSTLMKLGLVTKENPVTEPTNRRKTRYSLISDYDRFWYQIIMSRYEDFVNDNRENIKAYWNDHISEYMKPVFIRMCHEYLLRQCRSDKMPFSIKNIGSWWENNESTGESDGFDLMATGEAEGKNAYIFARCFFKEQQVDMMDVKELIDLTKKIHNKISTFYLFFSVNGFAENVQTVSQTIRNIMLIDLKDMV
ncbi:MAG: ArsR family transcriptional regulator [bacterium LCO1.1]|uniref:ArsR family transcriptional regulator n=1 Tax=Candidatus Weimeria bifida TaxID=2599074 RepID=A0A6N7J2E3_9FIRM|nr:ArsR family transcriptional regulator [Candidatus Weimeria bifida]